MKMQHLFHPVVAPACYGTICNENDNSRIARKKYYSFRGIVPLFSFSLCKYQDYSPLVITYKDKFACSINLLVLSTLHYYNKAPLNNNKITTELGGHQ